MYDRLKGYILGISLLVAGILPIEINLKFNYFLRLGEEIVEFNKVKVLKGNKYRSGSVFWVPFQTACSHSFQNMRNYEDFSVILE